MMDGPSVIDGAAPLHVRLNVCLNLRFAGLFDRLIHLQSVAPLVGSPATGQIRPLASMSTDSPFQIDAQGNSRDGAAAPRDGIWLDGDVLACACPECAAPMSVRLWLMVADCWRCGTSIELTEEQEREALRLLEEREAGPQASAPASKTVQSPTKPAKPKQPPASKPAVPAARAMPLPAPLPTPPAAKPPQRQVASHANRLK
jgi:hypothetical protein